LVNVQLSLLGGFVVVVFGIADVERDILAVVTVNGRVTFVVLLVFLAVFVVIIGKLLVARCVVTE
jgi:hypothetical protein